MEPDMRVSDKTAKLLQLYDESTKTVSGPERALYCLLKAYETEIPEPDDYFHKAFRQTDVTGDAQIDMAIWHLLHRAHTFWGCFEEVQGEKPLSSNDGVDRR